MECPCECQGYLDDRCRDHGMCGKVTKPDPLLALADFLVEDIMAMSDEEILAEMTPQDHEDVKRIRERALAIVNTSSPEQKADGLKS